MYLKCMLCNVCAYVCLCIDIIMCVYVHRLYV